MTTLLLLKLTIASGLVWVGTLVGRGWGPRAGGFVAGSYLARKLLSQNRNGH
jgi:hypothetical protein